MSIIAEDVTLQFSSSTLVGDIDHDPSSHSLVIFTDEGIQTLSLDTGLDSPVEPAPHQVHIKDYSELTGLASSLEAAGIVDLVGNYTVGPFKSPVYIAQVRGQH